MPSTDGALQQGLLAQLPSDDGSGFTKGQTSFGLSQPGQQPQLAAIVSPVAKSSSSAMEVGRSSGGVAHVRAQLGALLHKNFLLLRRRALATLFCE